MSCAEISSARIAEDLRKMGVSEGDHISLALALSKVGRVAGGPESFIDAVLDVLGPEGTLMMNTYTHFFHVTQREALEAYPPFDYRSTSCWTGLVPDTLRKHPGALRSRHPVNSITAVGKMAMYLTEGHDHASRPYLPYSRLAEIGGISLFIGLEDRMVALRHEAQYLANLTNVVPLEVCINYLGDDEEIRLFKAKDVFACSVSLQRLTPYLRNHGILKEGYIGNAPSILVYTKRALDDMAELLSDSPALTLCDDIACIWCRELERRLNLYGDIANPKAFQSNPLLKSAIALINNRRLGGSWAAIQAIGLVKKVYDRYK